VGGAISKGRRGPFSPHFKGPEEVIRIGIVIETVEKPASSEADGKCPYARLPNPEESPPKSGICERRK
jgi:hypothetical protein